MNLLAFLLPGRMPLPLAWMVALAVVPFALMALAAAAAGTPLDQPLFFGLLIGSVLGSMAIAAKKRRRWWLWGIMASVSFVLTLGLGPLLQPVTVVWAVALAERATPAALRPPLPVDAADDHSAGEESYPEEAHPDQARPEDQYAEDRYSAGQWSEDDRRYSEGRRSSPKPFRSHRPRRR